MKKGCGVSLLCVEDDTEARTLLEKLIRHKFPELNVYVAADGEEGVALYSAHRPEIVITDITMPLLDGIEMTKRIRGINPAVVVMALTAYSDTDWQARSRELNFNNCITKPVQFAPFLAAVGAAIESAIAKKPALS